MKTQIQTKNFGALGTRTIPLSSGVTLVAGPNAAGKSTLVEGVEWVLYGKPMRGCRNKADVAQAITDGASDGSVTLVEQDGAKSTMSLRTGNVISGRKDDAPHFAVIHGGLTALEPDQRRKALMAHFGIEVDGKALAERLAKSCPDVPEAFIDHVSGALRGGIEKGEEFAKTQASEARGAWQVHTGERYGSQKAEGWTAKPPEWDGEPLCEGMVQRLALAATDADAKLAAAQQALGYANALPQRPADLPSEKQLQAARKAKATADETVQKIMADLAELRAKTGTQFTHECPHCTALLRIDADAMRVDQADEPIDIADLQTQIAALDSELRQARADQTKAAQREANLAAAAREDARWYDDELTQQCEADVKAAQAARTEANVARDNARSALQQAKSAEAATNGATERHAAVKAWVAIAERLGPDGIAREIAGEAVSALTKAISDRPELPECLPDVKMTAAGDITVDGRIYERCSESERWRADLVLLVALAPYGSLVCVDRFDVLEPALRKPVLTWVVESCAEVQVLMAATLKADPGEKVGGADVVWLGGE